MNIDGLQRTLQHYCGHLWIKFTSRSTVTYQCTLITKAARRQRDDCLKVRVFSLITSSCLACYQAVVKG